MDPGHSSKDSLSETWWCLPPQDQGAEKDKEEAGQSPALGFSKSELDSFHPGKM